MLDSGRILALILVLVALAAVTRGPQHDGRAAAPQARSLQVSAADAQRTFAFAPGTAASDQQAFLQAIASARPPARRLIDLVDGLVTVSFTHTHSGSLGVTHSEGDGRFDVSIELDRTYGQLGMRGVDRVVLHELGHVVDFTLVPDELDRRLDKLIPQGVACDPGRPTGACAQPRERFAETFAKWATGDMGYDLWVGYKVMPPAVPLEQWGAPLEKLG